VEQIVSTHLLDAAFLLMVLGRFRSSQHARNHKGEKLSRQREKLERETGLEFGHIYVCLCLPKTSY
jgi:hypothetical protein